MISGFHHEVDEKCALLGYYAASSGNFLPMIQTFWILGPWRWYWQFVPKCW